MAEQITLYTHELSPFSHRIEIALAEAGIESQVIRYKIGLTTTKEFKPAWYTEKVNPLGTVPSIAYGPQPAPDQPSETSVKILESLVIVDFIAELYPAAKLLPSSPAQRAKARSFAAASDTIISKAWREGLVGGNSESFVTALDQIQSLLPDNTTYAVGNDFTVADISIAPWLGRLELLLQNDFYGKLGKGAGTKIFGVYSSSKYSKIREYNKRIQERASVKKTYTKELTGQYYSANLNPKQ